MALALAISVLFAVLAWHKVDVDALGRSVRSAELWPLALTQLLKGIGMTCMALRTRTMLRLVDLSVASVLRGHIEAFAVNSALPFRLGELYRVHYMAVRGNVSYGASVAAAALERLCDMLSLLVLFLAAFVSSARQVPALSALYGLAGGLAALMLTVIVIARRPGALLAFVSAVSGLFGERVQRALVHVTKQLVDGLVALASVRSVATVLLLSFCYWGTASGAVTLVLRSLAIDVPIEAAFVVLGFIAFGTALPSSPAFVGTYHFFAAAALTSVFGVDPVSAASFAVICHAVAFLPFALIGGVSLARDPSLFRTLKRAARAVSVRPPRATTGEAGNANAR